MVYSSGKIKKGTLGRALGIMNNPAGSPSMVMDRVNLTTASPCATRYRLDFGGELKSRSHALFWKGERSL
jgi:hypothetical protein